MLMRSVTSSNLGASQQPEWNRHGYFMIRGFAPPKIGQLRERKIVDLIRANPPACSCRIPAYIINDTLALQPEAKPVAGATKAEHRMSKAFKLCTRRIFARRKTG